MVERDGNVPLLRSCVGNAAGTFYRSRAEGEPLRRAWGIVSDIEGHEGVLKELKNQR